MNTILPSINTDFYKSRQSLSFKKSNLTNSKVKTVANTEFCHANKMFVNYLQKNYPDSWFAKIEDETALDITRTFLKSFLEIEESKKLSGFCTQTKQANSEIEEGLIMLYGESDFNNTLKTLLEFLNDPNKKQFKFKKYIKKVNSLGLKPYISTYDIARSGLVNKLTPNTSKKTVKLTKVREKVVSEILQKSGIPLETPLNEAIESKTAEKFVKNVNSALKTSPYYDQIRLIGEKLKQLTPPIYYPEHINYAENAADIVKTELMKINLK